MTYSALHTPRTAVRPVLAVPGFKWPEITPAMLLLVLTCLMGLLYLVQTTAVNANGYKLAGYQDKAAALSRENEDLTVASARLQSLDRQRQYAADSGLVDVSPE